MTYQTPSFYDSTGKVTRPMDSSAQIPPAQVPVSAFAGNQVQNFPDGLYVGPRAAFGQAVVYYVNSSTGVDDTAHGAKATPLASLAFALNLAAALFPNSQFNGNVTIALQAGQTFNLPANFNFDMWGGHLRIAFYGDANYGDFDNPIGTGCFSQNMADLNRPIITTTINSVSGQWGISGFNRRGGDISFSGVQINLPAAPTTPSITLYGLYSDIVRSVDSSTAGSVSITGTVINMTDTNSYWGFMGVHSRSCNTVFNQFASQFLVNGVQMTAANNPTTAQLTARQYFLKFYPGLAGNNQQTGVLSATAANSSTASGIFNLTWADTEALTVSSGKTNLASFPIMFDITYGFRNYVFGLQHDQQQRALNIVSSRLF